MLPKIALTVSTLISISSSHVPSSDIRRNMYKCLHLLFSFYCVSFRRYSHSRSFICPADHHRLVFLAGASISSYFPSLSMSFSICCDCSRVSAMSAVSSACIMFVLYDPPTQIPRHPPVCSFQISNRLNIQCLIH